MNIHPTAIVDEGVQLGANCVIHAHAIVRRGTVLGDGVKVHEFAVVGGDPQYLKFDPTVASGVRVGAGTVIRESVTINRSIYPGKDTVVGARCFIMAGVHIAHDCELADDVVLANLVLLAGHVSVAAFSFLGGAALVHQFVRIGPGAMVSGGSRMAQDVPPYAMTAERNEVIGLNLVGLKRRGVPREAIRELKEAFHAVYTPTGNIRDLARAAAESGKYVHGPAREFLAFFADGKRGFVRPRGHQAPGEDDAG
jgi:UDP-N-acetylglucosamine acyltransferase